MPIDLRAQPTLDLLTLWRDVMDELLNRGVLRGTAHSPVGDYAEKLVMRALGQGARRPDSPDKGVDIEYFPAGERRTVQVKARRHTKRLATHFDVSRFENHRFDELVCVLFREDWRYAGAWRLQWDAVNTMVPADSRKAGAKLRLRVAKIEDATARSDEGVKELVLDQSEEGARPAA